jgi:hypothetical protein
VAVAISILALGICMLGVWKYVAVRKDRLEFLKFKNEQENAKWNLVSTLLWIITHSRVPLRARAQTHTHMLTLYTNIYIIKSVQVDVY